MKDYNLDPNTYDGEFFQEDGLEGRFEITTKNLGLYDKRKLSW